MKLLILGAGAMGKTLAQTAEERDDIVVAGMVDPLKGESLEASDANADVVVDFSNPANLDMLTSYCSEHSCPAVIATTGLTEVHKKKIEELSKKVPVVFSANFSLGITIVKRILSEVVPVLENDFDMELIEKHHNKKLDAPSGTAKMLVEEMNKNREYKEVFGREGNCKRSKEIGVHAIRGGTIAGEHSVIFAGNDEIIEIKHTAGSKKIFASGAIKAAEFVQTATPGLYDMEDVLFGNK